MQGVLTTKEQNGSDPNEKREVVHYDHFAGENFSEKFLIKFGKKNFFTSYYASD